MGDSNKNDQKKSIVLEEEIDEEYEPNDEEIKEYAKYIGMDLSNPVDIELLWIAREGLKAPLPNDWKPCQTDDGEVYYFNFKSGESIWDHPCDAIFKKKYLDERAKRATGNGKINGYTVNLQQSSQQSVSSNVIPTVVLPQSNSGDFSKQQPIQSGSAQERKSSAGTVNLMQLTNDAKMLSKSADLRPMKVPSSSDLHSKQSASLQVPGSSSRLDVSKKSLHPSVNLLSVHASSRSLNSPMGKSDANLVSSIINLAEEARKASQQTSDKIRGAGTSVDDKQRDVVQQMLLAKIEELRIQFEEKEQDERQMFEDRLEAFRNMLKDERAQIEKEERAQLEKAIAQFKRELQQELEEQKQEVEQKMDQQLQESLQTYDEQLQLKEEKEKVKLDREYNDRLKKFREELELQYSKEQTEEEIRAQYQRKKQSYEIEAEKELTKLKEQLEAKKLEIQVQFDKALATQKDKLDVELAELQKQFKVKEQQEMDKLEQQSQDLKKVLKDKIQKQQSEMDAQEKHLQNQLKLSYQQQLKDREAEFEREYQNIESKWTEKLLKLKQQLQFEQNTLEDKLIIIRQHNQKDSDATFAAAIKMKRNELADLMKENEEEIENQQAKKRQLEKERLVLEKQEAELRQKSEMFNASSLQQKGQMDFDNVKSSKEYQQARTKHRARELSSRSNYTNNDFYSQVSLDSSSDDNSNGDALKEVDDMFMRADGDQSHVRTSPLAKELHKRLKEEEEYIKRLKEDARDKKQFAHDKQKQSLLSEKQPHIGLESAIHQPLDDTSLKLSEIDGGNGGASVNVDPQSQQELQDIISGLRKSYVNSAPLSSLGGSRYKYGQNVPAFSASFTSPFSGLKSNLNGGGIMNPSFELRQWEQERMKAEDLIRSHQHWLKDFRHRVGLQRHTLSGHNSASGRRSAYPSFSAGHNDYR
ncbi:hypothetical protein MP228_009363 [Amoeboaphelidium protococcarum]|nr:hypothetical protein MP228_009363 [Amoeboaphelidium protococcarum]